MRSTSTSKGCAVGSEPNGELIFVDLSGRKPEDSLGGVSFRGRKGGTIQLQKENSHDEARAFVAVHERVVANDARRVCHGEIENIRFAIGEELLWAGESGFKQTIISNARRTAMFVKLARVYRKNLRQIDPYYLCHLARVRRVLR